MSHHLSVYYVFLPRARLFYFLAVTLSHARSVLSTWLNSAQAATLSTQKMYQPQPLVENVAKLPLPKAQPQSPASSPRTSGESEKQKAGSAPSVANVSSISLDHDLILTYHTSRSLHFAVADFHGASDKGHIR